MAEDTVTLSRAEYDRLLARIEDLQDALTLAQAERDHDGVWIPGEVVSHEIQNDCHPVAAWRIYRDMRVEDLATAAGVEVRAVRAIEGGESSGTGEQMRALATALDAPVDVLIPDTAE